MPARWFGIRISLLYCFLFLGMGVQVPFLPLWLQDKGLSEGRIAAIVAAMIAVRIVTAPLGAFIADRYNNRRAIIIAGTGLSFAAYGLMTLMHGFWPILFVGIVAQAFFSPVVPLCETLAVEGSLRHHLDYGRLRLWGSLSFIGASLTAGAMLAHLPVASIIVMIAAGQGLLAAASLTLPREPKTPVHHDVGARLSLPDAARLLALPAFAVFMLAASLGQASHGLLYTFGSVHWDALGYGKPLIGLLWGVSVSTEIVLFFFSNGVVKRLGPVNLIALGTGGGVIRWLVMAGDPPVLLLFGCQALHALSFATVHLGTMHFIQRHVPSGQRNTAQGLYAAASGGAAMSAVMLASGPLYGALGGQAYFAMAAIAGTGLMLALRLRRLNPAARLAQG